MGQLRSVLAIGLAMIVLCALQTAMALPAAPPALIANLDKGRANCENLVRLYDETANDRERQRRLWGFIGGAFAAVATMFTAALGKNKWRWATAVLGLLSSLALIWKESLPSAAEARALYFKAGSHCAAGKKAHDQLLAVPPENKERVAQYITARYSDCSDPNPGPVPDPSPDVAKSIMSANEPRTDLPPIPQWPNRDMPVRRDKAQVAAQASKGPCPPGLKLFQDGKCVTPAMADYLACLTAAGPPAEVVTAALAKQPQKPYVDAGKFEEFKAAVEVEYLFANKAKLTFDNGYQKLAVDELSRKFDKRDACKVSFAAHQREGLAHSD
jgi:hypothetical protein